MSEINIESLSSEERVAFIQSIRRKVVENNPAPTDEELRSAIQCLRIERRTASKRVPKNGESKAPMKQHTMEDL